MGLREGMIAELDTIPAFISIDGTTRNYADQAPDPTELPYTVVKIDISETPAMSGDAHAVALRRLVQIDLWETRSNEDEALRARIWSLFDKLRLPGFIFSVQSVVRVPDPRFDLVHRAFTVGVVQPLPV